jgi:hypothetical protein
MVEVGTLTGADFVIMVEPYFLRCARRSGSSNLQQRHRQWNGVRTKRVPTYWRDRAPGQRLGTLQL